MTRRRWGAVLGIVVVGAVATALLSKVWWRTTIQLSAVTVPVKQNAIVDIIRATESANFAATLDLASGRFAAKSPVGLIKFEVASGTTASLAGSVSFITAGAGPELSITPGIHALKVHLSKPIRIRLNDVQTGEIADISADPGDSSAIDATVRLDLIRTLFSAATCRLITDSVTDQVTSRLISSARVDKLQLAFSKGASVKLDAQQELVLAEGGHLLFDSVTYQADGSVSANVSGLFSLGVGTRFTGSDFTLRPTTAKVSFSGAYSRSRGSEDFQLSSRKPDALAVIEQAQLLLGDAVRGRVESLQISDASLNWHTSPEGRSLSLKGSSSGTIALDKMPVPGGTLTASSVAISGAHLALESGTAVTFALTTSAPTSVGPWSFHGERGKVRFDVGGPSASVAAIAVAKLSDVAIDVDSGKLSVASIAVENGHCAIDAHLGAESHVQIATTTPIRVVLNPSDANAAPPVVGDLTVSGTLPSMNLRVGTRRIGLSDGTANLRLTLGATPGVAGTVTTTVKGESIGQAVNSFLGSAGQFGFEEMKVTGLHVQSDDASIKATFDVGGANEGQIVLYAAIPKGFEITASGTGLRESRLDASFKLHTLDAAVDLGRGEADCSLEFDIVNRQTVSPLTRSADTELVVGTVTHRVWIFINPFTVGMNAAAKLIVTNEGGLELALRSWSASNKDQGVHLDSVTHKMPGVHGDIKPIDASAVTLHMNYIGDFSFTNPVKLAVDRLIDRRIVLKK